MRCTDGVDVSDPACTYPLSRGQAALWFHYKSVPQSVAYNLAGAITVRDDTSVDALRYAFQQVADRHPLLRTRFASDHGEPVQHVAPPIPIAFRVQDTTGWHPAHLDARLAEEIARPFDLEHGPVWRVTVFQHALASDGADPHRRLEHLVLLTMHHIVVDLWSGALMLSEVAAFYREATTGTQARLKALRHSYADYVQEERGRLARPEGAASEAYWCAALSGELPSLDLPTDHPRPPVATGRGAVETLRLGEPLTADLRVLAEAQGVTLHRVLLAAFQALLNRYTGQDTVLVGFPKAGRAVSTARVVGYFVNQTVVRADFSGDPGFLDLLHATDAAIEAGAPHDWYPFSLLVQHLQPNRDLSRAPVIQAIFSWQQAPRWLPRENAGPFALGQAGESLTLGRLSMRPVHLPPRAAPFDLMMMAAEAPDGLTLTIEYALDLFDAATIARMAACYQVLLRDIAAAPAQLVSTLAILPEEARVRLVEGWNATAAPYPAQALHQLFELQVVRTPDTMAVADEDTDLTYQELNVRANRIAHFLLEHGAGPDCVVGVYMTPSAAMVTAILGILKAGAAYLPLDPENPGARLAFMLADAHPTLLITSHALRPSLPGDTSSVFVMDVDDGALHAYPETNPATESTPDHLAYVIYTSGSTGRPKGVALAHRGVVNLLADFQRRQPIREGDGCSWWTSPGFDVSVYEICSPLTVGGSLHVIPESLRLDAAGLFDWLCARSIRSTYLPPFFLEDFAAWLHNHPGTPPLRRLLVGVEPIPHSLLVDIRDQLRDLALINGYGPTETTICSTLYPVSTGSVRMGHAPIGRPVANTQVYLLDRNLKPVPVGVVGELYIGGVGLARGYLQRPELTAQRFIPSPFCNGERLYRTGDLARYLPDGNLVFVGRADTQVKLHGLRIELGEIEAVLAQHPDIKQAAVLLHEPPSGGKHLVAYVAASQGTAPRPEALQRFLQQRLPSGMVPAVYVLLEALPLTPSGKVNRRALPAPESRPAPALPAPAHPARDVERALVEIWQQVLDVEGIQVNDNFFELGGDSISSLRIVARAGEAGIQLHPRHVFEAPTVAGLAALAQRTPPARDVPAPDPGAGPIPLTPIQHWFFEQNFSDPHHWNQALLFVTPRPLDPAHLRAAVSALLWHHEVLRLRYLQGTEGWQQTLADTQTDVPFTVIDLAGLSVEERVEAFRDQVAAQQRSLNLATGPVIRVVSFVLGAGRPGRLLIVAHHLVVDAVSWPILLADLQRAYHQQAQGHPIRLPASTTAFHTWARHLADLAGSATMEPEKAFWERVVDSVSPPLPDDPLSPAFASGFPNTEAGALRFSVSLDSVQTRALLREAPDAYGTDMDDLLLTALARVLRRWRGRPVLWIDLEAHGREDIFDDLDLSRTVGWFTTLYPVRLDLPDDPDLGSSIKAIKEQRRRVPHHGLGFGVLRYLSSDSALRERLRALPPAAIRYNNLGQLPHAGTDEVIIRPAPEPTGPLRCPDARRAHLIEVDAAIDDGMLHVRWRYNPRVHAQHTIRWVADLFTAELRRLIAYCRAPETVGYTPSDFPDANLSQAEIDAVVQTGAPTQAPVPRRNLAAIYPLSSMQQSMVLHGLNTPDSGLYVEQTLLTLRGSLDVAALERAWQQVVDRHDSLRTAFVWKGLDRMRQVVHKRVAVPLVCEDWDGRDAAQEETGLTQLLDTERRRDFDLSTPPLARMVVVRAAGEQHHLLLTHHHALLDGWSVSLLLGELFACYGALIRGTTAPLLAVRPYRDYIAWLRAQDHAAAEAFWRRELVGIAPQTWDTDGVPPAPLTGAARPAACDQPVSLATTAALEAIARTHQLTLSTLIQGAWAVVLGDHCGRDDVVFGVTVAGRPADLPGSMTMVGLFINTLPLRVQLTPELPLLAWLQGIQRKALAIQQVGTSPLSRVQAWSGAPPGVPLFDTLLVVENYPVRVPGAAQMGDLRIEDVRAVEQAPYHITIGVTKGKQIHLRMLYDPARFTPDTARQVLGRLYEVLGAVGADVHQSLSTLRKVVRQADHQASTGGDDDPQPDLLSPHLTPAPLPQSRQPSHAALTREPALQAPRTPLESYLVRHWQKVLKLDEVGVTDDFFYLGGDSLTGAICIHQIRHAMQETVPLTAIFEAPTVAALARYLERAHPTGVAHLLGTPASVQAPDPMSTPAATRTMVHPEALVPIQPQGHKPPLFCVHPAGGIVFPYYALATYLGSDQPLFGLQDPSLYKPQAFPESIEMMAAGYVEAIRTVQPEGPVHLLGWSVGGLIAYEMARNLRAQGRSVATLILLDTRAPVRTRGIGSRVSRLPLQGTGAAARSIASYVRSGLFLWAATRSRRYPRSGDRPALHDLVGWAGLDTWRAALLRDENGVADAVSREASLLLIEMPDVQRILALVRAHIRLARRYTTGRYRGRVTLIRAVGPRASEEDDGDPTLGWHKLAEEGVTVHTLRANHVALFVKPHIEELAQTLRMCLKGGG